MLAKLFPLVLKLIPIVAAAWIARDWSIIESRGGFSTIQEILAIVIPALVGLGAAGAALYSDSRAVQVALATDPPIPTDSKTTVISTPSHELRLTIKGDGVKADVLQKSFAVLTAAGGAV